jgi:hypothetical protein
MVTTRSAAASSSAVIGFGLTPANVIPRSASTATTVGLRMPAGSVPAESARTPEGWRALRRAAATMLRPALWVQTNRTHRSDAGALTG